MQTQTLGPDPDQGKEVKVLNRIIRVTEEGWEYEADQRHGELIVQSLNLEEAKEVTTPGEDSKPWKEVEESEELSKAEGTDYRGLAARANYLAADRSDIQYAVKEIC